MNHFRLADPVPPLDPECHFDVFCECAKRTCWQKGMLSHWGVCVGGGGAGVHTPKLTTRH